MIQLDMDYVNSASIMTRNSKVVAINYAVEVDLMGQVCADSVWARIISGVGGQIDFMRGATLSDGGKPVIALRSRSAKGHPRIVASLMPGAGVFTTRAHVHYVATEHVVANLVEKTLGERARALIELAHHQDREELVRTWFEMRRRT